MVEKVPTWAAPSAASTRCSGPISFCASERVEVTNTRLAPTRWASAATASPAATPNTTRSSACTWKTPEG
ncbi:MAG TPA: hypothetical protein VIV01_20245, partial [Hyphomicrobiaceae bacterium]